MKSFIYNKKITLKRIIISLIIGAILVLLIANGVYRFKYVGSVDGTRITRTDYKNNLNQVKAFYAYSKQDLSGLTSLDKDTLEKMINKILVQNYAENNGITVTDAEIQARYLRVISGFNRNNNIADEGDKAFLSKIKEMYGVDKNTYLEEIKIDLLKKKVQKKVKMPLVQWLEEQKKSASINRF
jgi:FKBP-type peptidyl-prolyl cis-trans isomerase (trigger factor)